MNRSDRNVILVALLGTLVGFVFCVLGYFLVRGNRDEFGVVMFVLVPIAAGLPVGAIIKSGSRGLAVCLCAGFLSLTFLLFTRLEGIVCILMASPLLAAGLAIGSLLGSLIRRRWIDRSDAPERNLVILILLTPFLIAAANTVEEPFRHAEVTETFTSSVVVPTNREDSWRLVEKMDHLDGDRPFLLRLGIPTPYRCELEKPALGAKRICHFHEGILAQEVTAWNFPRNLDVKITESTLPGRHWLSFKTAAYNFDAVAGGTRITRHSTVGSRLYPRWYWRPLERWGVTSEHTFIFSNIKRWAEAASQ